MEYVKGHQFLTLLRRNLNLSKLRFHFFYVFLNLILFSFLFLNSYAGAPQNNSQDVTATHAMVASAHPIASSVGINILKQGGNAVDAAIATAFALSIAEPNASGIGGGGFMIIKMSDHSEAIMIDYREMAPKKATPEFYYKTASSFKELTRADNSTSIGIPGLASCAELALEKYGSMTMKQVLAPSIKLCRKGIIVSDKLNGMISDNYEKILKYQATSAIYLSESLPLEPGSVLKNTDLAATFEKIANHGAKIFYEGEIARAIVTAINQQGGIFELSDLKSYQAKLRKPVIGNYRGYQIISSAPPSGGGTHLAELLNIMESFNVKSMGHNSVQFIHAFAEAMKMVYADKAAYAADPDFFDVPVDSLIAKKHAKKLHHFINMKQATFDYSPPVFKVTESNSTSHLSVVDEQGNIVALTQSINSFFGSGVVVPGTGILLNNHLSDFDAEPDRPNSIAPHKRPTSSIAPTIILKNGKPFMTLGTPGGTRIISALAQIIMNVIDFNMSIDEAIEAPRVHCLKKILHLEGRIAENVRAKLEKMGHTIKVRSDFDNYFGGAQAILIDPETGILYGGADSRRDGIALGY